MKTFAMVIILALASATADAQHASTKDILTWIAGHFESLTWARPSANLQTTNDAQLDFDGCQVTLTLTTTTTPNPSGANYPLIDTRVYGPFQLNTIRPDVSAGGSTLTAGGLPARLFINAVTSLPEHMKSVDGGDLRVDTVQGVIIFFSSKEMADRQAKAWHDAIISCGGKAVPDNLY